MASQKVTATFRDIGELGRVAGFDLNFRQLEPGPAPIPANLHVSSQMTVVHMEFPLAYHQLGTPPAGMRSFGVPIRRMRNWCGRDYSDYSILPFDLANGVDGVSSQGFSAFAISIRPDFVSSVSQAFQVPVAEVLTEPSSTMTIRNCSSTQLFRSQLARLFQDDACRLDEEYQDEIALSLLHASFSDTEVADKSEPVTRATAISRALEFVNDHRDETVTVRSICAATGIPLRTMNRAFRERFGIGPKAYLRRQRLSDVRSALVGAPEHTVIADVANDHGFWHLGQFAKDYRLMFGELPSATLRRN